MFASDGETYERESIEEWIRLKKAGLKIARRELSLTSANTAQSVLDAGEAQDKI